MVWTVIELLANIFPKKVSQGPKYAFDDYLFSFGIIHLERLHYFLKK